MQTGRANLEVPATSRGDLYLTTHLDFPLRGTARLLETGFQRAGEPLLDKSPTEGPSASRRGPRPSLQRVGWSQN